MNCPSFGATAQTVAFASRLWAAGHRQWMLWKVEDTGIWTDPCSKLDCGKVAMSGLVGDWEHRLDRMMDSIKTMPDFANRTFGFNLGDELLGEGVPLANVTAVARRSRSTFGHPTFIYWNEVGSVFSPPTNGKAPRYRWHLGCILLKMPAISLLTGTAGCAGTALDALPPSALMHPLLGLNLLHLVVESRLSEFHSERELLPAGAREQGPIKFPLEIEQQLMEGSYSEVLSVTREGPTTEFGRHAKPLVDTLEATVRDEIASCAEKAYKSLSVDAAVALMHLDDAAALREYIAEEKEGLWLVGADDRVRFADAGAGARARARGGGGAARRAGQGDARPAAAGPAAGAGEGSDVNAHVTMAQNIKYATELERIV